MSSFEKSVKGGTKVKLAPPKSKYVEHILIATQSGEAGVAEVFRTLTYRLRDSTWTVAFKALIIVHLMIKEGAKDVTLSYLSVAPKNRLAINHPDGLPALDKRSLGFVQCGKRGRDEGAKPLL